MGEARLPPSLPLRPKGQPWPSLPSAGQRAAYQPTPHPTVWGPSPAPFGWSLAIPPVLDPFSLTTKCLQLPAPSSLILKWFPPVSAQRIPQSGGGLSVRREQPKAPGL
ncbi:hypothetical protein H8959_019303 [Pygathrix nigripes]